MCIFRFAAFLYICRLKGRHIPYAVALSRDRCEVTRNMLTVPHIPIVTNKTSTLKSQFTVCVSPIHFNYNDVNQLVEFMEVNQIFGADKFVFYNLSIGPDVNQYLQQYAQQGLIDIIQWKIPLAVDLKWPEDPSKDIHYFGELAALNDCIYRYLYWTKFLVFIDLDEVIVPRTAATWESYMTNVATSRPSGTNTCAYIFPNVFFRTEWSKDTSVKNDTMIQKYNLQTLLVTKREDKIWHHGIRSKYIADPQKIEIYGIHFPWKCLGGKYEYYVPETEGLLFHYRSWDNPKEENWVLDRTMHVYRSVIMNRVRDTHIRMSQLLRKG